MRTRNTLIAAALLASAASPALADTVTDYSLNAIVDIGLEATYPNSPPYDVAGAFVYDDTTASVTSWNFRFAEETGDIGFSLGLGQTGTPLAQTNAAVTSFEFWEGSPTSYPSVRSFTFDIDDPLLNGSEPLVSASYFGVNESVGDQGLVSGTLLAMTDPPGDPVPEPATWLLLSMGMLGMMSTRFIRIR